MNSPSSGVDWVREMADESAVGELAGHFAEYMQTPTVIFLRGDLGAGKTTFARAYIKSLGFSGYVKSPSYGLLETYHVGPQTILHLDLYRIEDPEELEYLAIRDLFNPDCVLLVEWPDQGKSFLPKPDILLNFDEKNEVRFIRCQSCTPHGQALSVRVSDSIR